jgi:hypothetical protein
MEFIGFSLDFQSDFNILANKKKINMSFHLVLKGSIIEWNCNSQRLH